MAFIAANNPTFFCGRRTAGVMATGIPPRPMPPEARVHARLTQVQLSFRADVHRTYVSDLERGLKSPTLDAVDGLSRALRAGSQIGPKKTIGDEVAELLLTAGVVVALYTLLSAALKIAQLILVSPSEPAVERLPIP